MLRVSHWLAELELCVDRASRRQQVGVHGVGVGSNDLRLAFILISLAQCFIRASECNNGVKNSMNGT